MALTASATIQVRNDIVQQLKLDDCKWFKNSLNRPNLQYTVKPKRKKKTIGEIIEFIKNNYPHSSGIVYCLSRTESENLVKNTFVQNIK